jgi:hypothetical protein
MAYYAEATTQYYAFNNHVDYKNKIKIKKNDIV